MNKAELLAHARKRFELAEIYLQDGAPRRASEIVFELATELRSWAIDREAAMAELAKGGKP